MDTSIKTVENTITFQDLTFRKNIKPGTKIDVAGKKEIESIKITYIAKNRKNRNGYLILTHWYTRSQSSFASKDILTPLTSMAIDKAIKSPVTMQANRFGMAGIPKAI